MDRVTKTGAAKMVWERPRVVRIDASNAEMMTGPFADMQSLNMLMTMGS